MKSLQHIIAILLLIAITISNRLIAQENSNPVQQLSKVLQSSANDFAKNKVFIKTDKDIYCPGEKIWFKAEIYNCLTEELSIEHELIVMLKGENGEIITDSKYLAANGICDNELNIPSWTPEGNVYLVAYSPKAILTNDATLATVKPITINSLKRNDYVIDIKLNKEVFRPGEEVKLTLDVVSLTPGAKREKMIISLFDYNQRISSEKVFVETNRKNEIKYKLPDKVNNGLYFVLTMPGKNRITRKIPLHTSEDNISVVFYPEGGTLLTNNIQRILYRTTDPFGKPVDISGKVFDQQGNQAGAGKNLKKGYGLISLMPLPNQKYYFKIEDEYGKDMEFELPEAVTDGSFFSLIKTEDSTLKVGVFTSGKYNNETLTLVAISNGKIISTTEVVGDKKNTMKIPTNSLPHGIVNFVILSQEGKILSERLVYNTPNRENDIGIETKFKPSEKNGEVEISIDVSKFTDRFGPSTIDLRIVDKYNLFEPEYQPNYSFLKYPLQTPVPKTVLDIYLTNLELIANEIKHYSLEELLAGKDYYKQELGKNISGVVIDKNRKGVANATVMATQMNNLFQATTTTDSKGKFIFDGISKSKNILVKAFNSSGKKSYAVHLDQTFDESLDEIILLESFRFRQAQNSPQLTEYYHQNKELLKLIGSEHRDPRPEKLSGTERLLQSGSSILDVIKMTKPFHLDGNQIVFYGSENSVNYQSGALIVIDGQKMGTDISALNSVNPSDVLSINISTNPVDIQQYTGLNSVGIIEISTRSKPSDFDKNQKNTGFHETSSFDAETFSHNVWRYQTTLLWKNNIPVDESGIVTMKIKVSEIQSEFMVLVEAESKDKIRHQQSAIFSTVRLSPSE